jgi:hypothetical protein
MNENEFLKKFNSIHHMKRKKIQREFPLDWNHLARLNIRGDYDAAWKHLKECLAKLQEERK